MNRKRNILTFVAILFSILLFSQQDSQLKCYWISFNDKDHNPYQIDQPGTFLSERAIARRAKYRISVDSTDLPVTPTYIDYLRTQGLKIQYSSRWLNGVSVVANEQQIATLDTLPFITSSTYISPFYKTPTKREYEYKIDSIGMKTQTNPYGRSYGIIQMLNGDSLHQSGHRGEGMLIAVLDGGFINVDKIPFFDSLRQNQGFEYFYDFTDMDQQVFESSSHGTSVLSAMAANSPGILVGTAPKAKYICIKTEEIRGEYRKEEYNWVAALEYVDSLGADVVNSSLGYYNFSDSAMNYQPEDLDGKTSPASRAASLAFARGMIIVVSAGNEGDNKWKYIDIPADPPEVLAIGAVRRNGSRAGFSSFGYDSIAVIKPDLAAPGVHIPVPNAFRNSLSATSGTSLAAPIMTGLISCLWQAFPEFPNSTIVAALKATASQASQPDRALGYGMPDFMVAYRWLLAQKNNQTSESE